MKKISILLLFAVVLGIHPSLHAQAPCLGTPQAYLAGTGTKTICSADFNGDGKPDLALGNHTSSLSVLLNNGAGIFGTPIFTSVDALPWALCTSDFNNDGKADLATHNIGPGTVSVLLGNGTGQFNAAAGFSTGLYNNSVSLCTGDFDTDGKADLAISSGFNYMLVALGNGDGTFDSTTQFSTGGGRSILSADFNGDGKADLATTQSVMLGNGTGGFGAPIALNIGVYPSAILAADFNGDGKMDLAATDKNDNVTGNLSVALGNGTGNFAAPTPYPVGTSTVPSGLCAGDFNGDGKTDLAAATIVTNNVGKVSMLLGNGLGAFAAPFFFVVDSFPNAIIAADLNADGKSDLALAVAQSNADTTGEANILLNCNTLGFDEANENTIQLAVFPNPNAGTFTVSCPQTMDRISVVDLLGKVVYQTRPNTQNQTVQLTENGIYIVIVTAKDQTFLQKIVIAQ